MAWRPLVGEQACEAWVGPQADQVETDEPDTDHGQRAKVVTRFIQVPTLEHQDGVSSVGPEVRLAHHTRLDERPQGRRLCTRVRRECLGRRARHFGLEGEDAHGVLRPAGGDSRVGRP